MTTLLELKQKIEPTLEDVALVLLDDIKEKYQITNPKDLDDMTLKHYLSHGWKENGDSLLNRDIFMSPDKHRLEDYMVSANANKVFKKEKGEHLDACCELIEIEHNPAKGFQSQVKFIQLWEGEVIGSTWYQLIIRNWDLMKRLYGIVPPKDFKTNPLPFLKTFCDKVFGISCLVNQSWNSSQIKEREKIKTKLIKEHIGKDIYRHYFGLSKTPRANGDNKGKGKLGFSKRYIIERDPQELTATERRFKQLQWKHFEITRKQPRYIPYMSEKFPFTKQRLDNRAKKEKNQSLAGSKT